MMTADTPYYDFNNLDENEHCYSNVVAITGETEEVDAKF